MSDRPDIKKKRKENYYTASRRWKKEGQNYYDTEEEALLKIGDDKSIGFCPLLKNPCNVKCVAYKKAWVETMMGSNLVIWYRIVDAKCLWVG